MTAATENLSFPFPNASNVGVARIPTSRVMDILARDILNALDAVNRSSHYYFRRTPVAVNEPGGYASIDFVIDEDSFRDRDITPLKIATALGSQAHCETPRVMLFEFKNYLVVMYKVRNQTLEMAQALMGYGGGGRLLCDVLTPYGFEFTADGIFEVMKDGDRIIEKLEVTPNWYSCMEILNGGRHYYAYQFQNNVSFMNDHYLRVSRLVTFTLASVGLNAQGQYIGDPARANDTVLTNFHNYLRAQGLHYPVEPTAAQRKMVEKAVSSYETYVRRRKHLVSDYSLNKLVSAKFNSGVVEQMVGIKPGREQNAFMDAFVDSFVSPGQFEFFILSSTPDTIQEKVKTFRAEQLAQAKEAQQALTAVVDAGEVLF